MESSSLLPTPSLHLWGGTDRSPWEAPPAGGIRVANRLRAPASAAETAESLPTPLLKGGLNQDPHPCGASTNRGPVITSG